MTCLKKTSSGKKAAALFLVFVVAASGIMFANPWEERAHRMPERSQPAPSAMPPAPLPSEEVVKAYHAAVLEHCSGLLQAKVAAGMITQERADVGIAMIKAHQSECKGECITNHSAGKRHF
ncbi:MAG: hypothetical protein NC041_02275 [Bacteroides sp.]|nr:hypothetical protein [Prevotella sp.]MCM1407571.1 hypothetical protein [Treponema brennaborense]MCM1469279.1 hypothetical protein [Bacteroides sp.]